jgi:hypothetical protein
MLPDYYPGIDVYTFADDTFLANNCSFPNLRLVPDTGPIPNMSLVGNICSWVNAHGHDLASLN